VSGIGEEPAGHAMMQLSGGPSKKAAPKGSPSQKGNSSASSSQKGNSSAKATPKSHKKGNATAKAPDASNVGLTAAGYQTIAGMCCQYEMEEFIRRITENEDLKVCNEGGMQGIVPFYSCEFAQNYSTLLAEVKGSGSGTCPWSAPANQACKKISKACGSVADPMGHRRRNCGRNDNSKDLDLEMQNAATNEFIESKCGTHQQYSDVSSTDGVLKACKVKGDITSNETAKIVCLDECCTTDDCIGIVIQKSGTTLQKSYAEAEKADGAIAYLHRQR